MEVQNNIQTDIKPDSWLVWSILATILCCPPFGIAGIVFAAKVDSLWSAGRHDEAIDAAKKAKMWTIVAICVGAVVGLLYGILVATGVSMGIFGDMYGFY